MPMWHLKMSMEEDAEDGQGVYQCTIKYNGTLAEDEAA